MKKALAVLVMAGFMASASVGFTADKAEAPKDKTVIAKTETKPESKPKAAETKPAETKKTTETKPK